MKILRIDGCDVHEKSVRVVCSGIGTREEGVKEIVRLAREKARSTPNDPHVDQSGPDEVSVFIGIYRIVSFRLVVE